MTYTTAPASTVKTGEDVSLTFGPGSGRRSPHFIRIVSIERYTVKGVEAVDLSDGRGMTFTLLAGNDVVVAR